MSDLSLYTALPNLIIGFHGCDQETFEKIIYDGESLNFSENPYDWLGNGMYFWEQNLQRAWEWAEESMSRRAQTQGDIKNPAVIGAVINLGNCLNLLDSNCIELLKTQYDIYKLEMEITGKTMPENKKYRPFLDCAVIESLHNQRVEDNELPFDSVRGVFFEGNPIYEKSGFMERSHIQICIRNPNCIKGYFNPREMNTDWINP